MNRAAIEASDLIALIKPKSQTSATHAKIKFDIQIVSIAKAEGASVIYSDDEDIERYAKRWKIPVKRICDLPLPPPKEFPKIDTRPIGESQTLFELNPPQLEVNSEPISEISQKEEEKSDDSRQSTEQPKAGIIETPNELKADSTHPAPVRGSDEGRAEGEAASEGPAKA